MRSPRRCVGSACVLSVMVMFMMLASIGCASSVGPEYLSISAGQYDKAFDAAARVARSHGLVPGLRDRRGGVIETEPAKAGSILEPHDQLNATLGEAIENTVSLQRRIARFEFLPVVFDPARVRDDDALTGPDIFGHGRQPLDLTDYEGDLELRVWVYVERLDRPGLRRSTWTRRKTTRAVILTDPDANEQLRSSWRPIKRDPKIERMLLARVQRELD